MQHALVTGGAGFLGSHLVDELLAQGCTVRVLDNFSTGTRENLDRATQHSAFELVEGDIRDAETVTSAMADVDTVFHQGAFVSVPGSIDDPATATAVNCTGTATVLDAARQGDVESVVLASSAAVYGPPAELPLAEDAPLDPQSPYALSKRYTEQLARQYHEQYGLDTVSLRYFNIFGPRQDPGGEYAAVISKFIELMSQGKRPVIYGDGEQSRDFIYVSDVVDANLQAARSDCSDMICNVARGERRTINELVRALNTVLESDLEPRYEEERAGDIRHSGADISTARAAIGFEPTVAFEEGLARTVRSFS